MVIKNHNEIDKIDRFIVSERKSEGGGLTYLKEV